jgi:23S rRNA (guanosine2251-2'-O)-methyltransferase
MILSILVAYMTKKSSLVIIGRHPVLEALRAGQPLDKVMTDRMMSIPELLTLCKEQGVPIQRVPKEKLDYFGANHQGVAAYRSNVEYTDLEVLVPHLFEQGKTPLLIILDRITDVGNFGAISRSAEVLGADGIIFPVRESAQLNADAVKRSSGALLRVSLCRVKDLNAAVRFLQQSGISVIAADGKGQTTIDQVDLRQPAAIVLGSEGQGVANEIIRKADYVAHIPQAGEMDSLNVSVAAGIMLYEVQRQRQVKSK